MLKEESLVKHSPLLGIVMLALAFAAGSIALAADYHMGTTLHCSDCHNMHGSLTHGQDGNPANPALVGGPTTFLLKGADPNSMCLACHDGTTLAPDVMGANTGSFVREAGGLPTGTTPYESWKGHSLGSMATAPGGTFSNPTGLECVDCHNQHGVSSVTGFPVGYTNGQWRNLKNKPGGSANNTPITYAVLTKSGKSL